NIIPQLLIVIATVVAFYPYGQKIHLGHIPPFMPPLDDSTARAHPVFRGTEPAPRDEYSYPEGTAKRCPCPDDSAPHGNARHIRLARVVRSARRTVSPWTGPPPSPI